MVISMEPGRVDNSILLDYLTSKVALDEPKIESTDRNILLDNTCTHERLHFWMPGGSRDYHNECDECDTRNAIPIPDWRRWAVTDLNMFNLKTSDVHGYEGDNGDSAEANDEEGGLQAEDGSTENVEDCWHSTRECEDWTVYFRSAKYDNGETNATTSNVSEARLYYSK